MSFIETSFKKKKKFFDWKLKLFGNNLFLIDDIPADYLNNILKSATLGVFSFLVLALTITFVNFMLVWASLGFIMEFLGLPFPEWYFIVFLYVLRAFWHGKLFRHSKEQSGADFL